jgi:streptogramin lyase
MKSVRTLTILFVLVCMSLVNAYALEHSTVKIHPERSFSTGWTHAVDTPNGIFWYNSQTGAGAVGQFDSSGNYTNTRGLTFSAGWTAVISTPEGLVWYNAKTGSAVIGRLE